MCQAISGFAAIIDDAVKTWISANTDSHTEIATEFSIRDTPNRRLYAFEITPKKGSTQDTATWAFRYDSDATAGCRDKPSSADDARIQEQVRKDVLFRICGGEQRKEWKSNAKLFVYGGTAEVRCGTAAVYGGTAEVRGGTAVVWGGTAVVWGGTADVRGGTAEVRGGTAVVRCGTAAVYGGTAEVRGGTAVVWGGTADVRGGTAVVWGGTADVRGGTADVRGGNVGTITIYTKPKKLTGTDQCVIIDRTGAKPIAFVGEYAPAKPVKVAKKKTVKRVKKAKVTP
jgi:hypothetical protein